MDFNHVERGLYLGSRRGLQDFLVHHANSALNVLTIESENLSQVPQRASQHMFVQVDDVKTADLLSHFNDMISFIRTGLLEGVVYVHCRHGISRSAAACAAYLMAEHGLSAEDAVQRLRQSRPFVSPNAGFCRQLELFGRLGCRTSLADPVFRRYRLSAAARAAAADIARLPSLCEPLLLADAGLPGPGPGSGSGSGSGSPPAVYRCGQCRTALFSERSVIRDHQDKGGSAASLRVLLQPWMAAALRQPRGRLSCPRCARKLGSFGWLPDSGAMVEDDFEPWFLITRSRVDHCPPRLAAPFGGQRPLVEKVRTAAAYPADR